MYQYIVWNKKLEREKKKLVFFPFCSFHNIHIIYLLRPSTIMIHLALRLAHSDSKWLKLAGNKLSKSDLTSFDKKISANLHYFRFRSLPGQNCQIVAVTIMIRIFRVGYVAGFWQLTQLYTPLQCGSHTTQALSLERGPRCLQLFAVHNPLYRPDF